MLVAFARGTTGLWLTKLGFCACPASTKLTLGVDQRGECAKNYMNAATSAQVKNAAYGYDYGYQTWVYQRGPVFIWMGVYGQRTFVDKANQKILILFRSSGGDDFVTQVTRTYWAP
jgi:CubicO group peptidase (beta-lactamase class C family)